MNGNRIRRGPGGPLAPVGEVLDGVLRRLRLEERFASADATERWDAAVGPEMAERTRCEGVRDRELLVFVRGAARMADLAVRRHEILRRINEELPEGAKLRAIRLAPMRGKEGTGRDRTR